MKTINLKDFYPWYTVDEYVEVSDEVAAELLNDKQYEATLSAARHEEQGAVFS